MKPSRTLEDLKIARDLINKKTITHNLVRYTLPYEMWLRVKRTYPDLLPFTAKDIKDHIPQTGCIYMDDRVQYFVEVKQRANNERKQPIHANPNTRKTF